MGIGAREARTRTLRRIRKTRLTPAEQAFLRANTRYEGNPQHKRNPQDFGLTPPASPRRDATLCDEAGQIKLARAVDLLALAIDNGLVSEVSAAGDYPKQMWAYDGEYVFEAMYTSGVAGAYHGYPIRQSDPLFEAVVEAWARP